MWRVILRIISVISFLAGIVGWITLPDDAPLWPKRVGPLLSSMSKDDLLIALFALSAAGFVATFAGPLIGARLAAIPNLAGRTKPAWAALSSGSPSPLAIDFPGIESAEDHRGDHYRVTSVLPPADGKPVEAVPIVREVRFAVRNESHRTVDDVSVKVRTVGFGQEPAGTEAPRRFRPRAQRTSRIVMQTVDVALPLASGEGARASIPPGGEERFTLLTLIGKDVAPVPGLTMMDCPRSVVHQLIGMHDAGDFSIGSSRTQCSITRNDSVELRVVVTGRDVCPIYGCFFADLHTRLRVNFTEVKSLD
ncbi:MAG TPA: hypothetical protein VFY87_17130 [Geminicoccaceae bacterium]|nr:hypothetical protein [Geminicoccaceae bacterium]